MELEGREKIEEKENRYRDIPGFDDFGILIRVGVAVKVVKANIVLPIIIFPR